MSTKSTNSPKTSPAGFPSPVAGFAYQALVFARENAGTALYFVAGVAGGPWAAPKALAASHKAHGGNCFYCKKVVAKGQATIDHVEPLSVGGKNKIHNLVIACRPCNIRKGHEVIDTHNPEAGREWLEALLKQVQQRLNNLNPPSSPQRPSPGAAGDP